MAEVETSKGRAMSGLAGQVYGQILSQLILGAYRVGARLPSEMAYCDMYSVSRPVVRDALARLAADGIIESRKGSGTFLRRRPSARLTDLVTASDLSKYMQCIEYRIELEGAAAAFAAERRTPEQFEVISQAYDRLRAEQEADFITPESDIAFHSAIVAASGNLVFIDTMNIVNELVIRLMQVSQALTRDSNEERIQSVAREHFDIYDAIKVQEPIVAKAAVQQHLARSRRRVLDQSQNENPLPSAIFE